MIQNIFTNMDMILSSYIYHVSADLSEFYWRNKHIK